MGARQLAEESVTPIEFSLRIRHPSIDPKEISAALGVEPEHCFKAGDPRTNAQGRRTSQHTQTYWLARITPESWADPIDPTFLSVIAESYPARDSDFTTEEWRKAAQKVGSRGIETMLFFGLQRVNARRTFLDRIQSEGGDVSLILAVPRDSAPDFILPVSMSRLLGKLGITLEFKFES